MVEEAELLAVVGGAHELAPAAGVAVMQPPVPGPVTVALSLPAGVLGGAAAAALVVAAGTPLAGGRLVGGSQDRGSWGRKYNHW